MLNGNQIGLALVVVEYVLAAEVAPPGLLTNGSLVVKELFSHLSDTFVEQKSVLFSALPASPISLNHRCRPIHMLYIGFHS